MSVKLEDVAVNTVKLTITIPAEDFEKAVQQAYLKAKKNISIPGFRKGKAPRKIIENMYGAGVFYEDAIDIALPGAYEDAVTESGIDPVDRPTVDITSIGEGDVEFTAEVTVKPQVELGEYKGLEVEQPSAEVNDSQIEAQLKNDQDRLARWVDVEDRAVVDGDKVIIDYSGFLGEEQFEGGTAKSQSLDIGSGSFIPGFEEQVIGMSKGEEKDLNVTFPEEYQAEELAGKDVVFKVVLHEVKEKELPKIDDDFAQDVSEFDTLDEYKADIKVKLEETAKNTADGTLENNLVNAASENATVEIPDCMVESQIDYMIQDMQYRMSMQGINMEDYMRITNTTLEQLREQYKPEALPRVKSQLVLEAIQDAEGVEATDEEVDAEIAKMAEQSTRPIEEIKETLSPQMAEQLADQVKINKTLAILKDSAKVTTV